MAFCQWDNGRNYKKSNQGIKMKLGVNVDHVATLRTARGTTKYPDPVTGALLAEYAGCDSIVAHLREDRRHVKERDVVMIKEMVKIPFNLEMSIAKEIVEFALCLKPDQVTLVPEKRQELTTEGGLDLVKGEKQITKVIEKFHREKIKVSLFIDPVLAQIKKAKEIGAEIIEINTGKFSEAKTKVSIDKQLEKIKKSACLAKNLGFFVAAGHGLNYETVKLVAKIKEIEELNIGHSIISQSIFVGISAAVEEMINLIK